MTRPPTGDTGLDALSGPARPDARARLRSSRFGTLIVLAVTAALVVAGVWLVQVGTVRDAAAQSGGSSIVKLPGITGVPAPEIGRPAHDLTVTLHDGSTTTLGALRGQVVWLTFGASWCTSCQSEVPDVQAAHEKYGPRGLAVLGIHIGEDRAAVAAYAKRVGLTYRLGADPNSTMAADYAVSSIPAHYFIDRQGVVVDIRRGALSEAVITNILDGLVGR